MQATNLMGAFGDPRESQFSLAQELCSVIRFHGKKFRQELLRAYSIRSKSWSPDRRRGRIPDLFGFSCIFAGDGAWDAHDLEPGQHVGGDESAWMEEGDMNWET